jgi:hypothetical protein
MDAGFRGSAVALGAALFNAKVAAAHRQVLGPVTFRENVNSVPLLARLELKQGSDPGLASLYEPMLARETNRKLGASDAIPADMAELLHTVAEREGARLHLLTGRDDIAEAANLLAAADRIRYLTPRLHADLMSELRWPGDQHPETGIDVRSLELDPDDFAVLDILRRSEVMAHLGQWKAGNALRDDTHRRLLASSAIAVISVCGSALADYARGGSAVEAVWIAAQHRGLAVQPISPVFLYAHDPEHLTVLSAPFADELWELRLGFRRLIRLNGSASLVLVMRFAWGTPASVRSARSLDRVSFMEC